MRVLTSRESFLLPNDAASFFETTQGTVDRSVGYKTSVFLYDHPEHWHNDVKEPGALLRYLISRRGSCLRLCAIEISRIPIQRGGPMVLC